MQTKIPRPCSVISLLFACRPRNGRGRVKCLPRLHGVIAEEVDRLPEIGLRVVERLARFADQEREQPEPRVFVSIRRTV